MSIELAKAYVQIVPSADGIQGGIQSVMDPEADKAGKSAGEKISGGIVSGIGSVAGAGAAAFGAITAAGTAATGMLVSGVGSVAEYGDNIDKMSQKMGMSAEAYQEWDAVMQHSGTSMETMKASMKTLANAAESGSDAFDKLGISQEEIASMSQEQLFERTISALQNVEDSTERTYLAGKTLGRGATELGALLNTSAEDTQAMRDRVRELGGVMSEDAVKAAAAYQDSLQDMQTAFSGLSRGMLQEFLPSVTQIMDGLTEIFNGNSDQGIGMVTEGIQSMLDGVGEMLPQMAEIATQIITAIAQSIIVNLPQIVEAGISIIGTLSQSLLESLPLIGEALLGVGEVILSTLTEYGPTLLEKGLEMVTNLGMGLIEGAPAAVDNFGQIVDQVLAYIEENLPVFLDHGIQSIEQLAMGILENAPSVIASMGEITTNLISFFMEHMPEYLQKGVELLQHIGQGILENGPEILTTMGKVLVDIIGTIAENLPEFLAKGVDLLVELGKGLIQGIPDLLGKLPEIFDSILDEFGKFDWASIGSNIINGIIDGIKGIASNLGGAVIGAVSDAWDGLVSWLDIRSPSHKAENIIGKNWALGIGVGFQKYLPEDEMTLSTKHTMDAISNTIDRPMRSYQAIDRVNNAGIIAEIRALKDAIASMRIVMDSGETVGVVDQGLGLEAARAAWQ